MCVLCFCLHIIIPSRWGRWINEERRRKNRTEAYEPFLNYLAHHMQARALDTGSARPCVNNLELSVFAVLRFRAPFC